MSFKVVITLMLSVLIVSGISCKGGVKQPASDKATDAKKAEYVRLAEFDQMVSVFKGFGEIVEQNKNNPDKGVAACSTYAATNIPKIKELESKIKKVEMNASYINDLVNMNNSIKDIADKITKTVTENYGVQGVDIMLQLSDMALARM